MSNYYTLKDERPLIQQENQCEIDVPDDQVHIHLQPYTIGTLFCSPRRFYGKYDSKLSPYMSQQEFQSLLYRLEEFDDSMIILARLGRIGFISSTIFLIIWIALVVLKVHKTVTFIFLGLTFASALMAYPFFIDPLIRSIKIKKICGEMNTTYKHKKLIFSPYKGCIAITLPNAFNNYNNFGSGSVTPTNGHSNYYYSRSTSNSNFNSSNANSSQTSYSNFNNISGVILPQQQSYNPFNQQQQQSQITYNYTTIVADEQRDEEDRSGYSENKSSLFRATKKTETPYEQQFQLKDEQNQKRLEQVIINQQQRSDEIQQQLYLNQQLKQIHFENQYLKPNNLDV